MRKAVLILLAALVTLTGPARAADELQQVQMLKVVFRRPTDEWKQALAEHRGLLDASFFERCEKRIRWSLENNLVDDAMRFALVADLAAQVVSRPPLYRLELAKAFYKAGNNQQCIDLLTQILITDRDPPTVAVNPTKMFKANLLFEAQNFAPAYEVYKELVAANHEAAECLYRMAFISHLVGKDDQALKEVNQCLQRQPGHQEARKLLALIQGVPVSAPPGSPGAPGSSRPGQGSAEAQKSFDEAERAYRESRWGDAEKLYLAAIQADPKMVKAYVYLGALYYRNKNLDLAIKFLQQAVEIDPGDVEGWRFLGNSYERRYDGVGNPEDLNSAVSCYQKAAALAPDSAVVQGELDRAVQKLRGSAGPPGS
jgi:tetratricopeptide (TPR) repeat protein